MAEPRGIDAEIGDEDDGEFFADALMSMFEEPDPYDEFDYEIELPEKAGPLRLRLHGVRADMGQLIESTGLTMWAAASALADYITRESGFRLLRGRRVVELGAGLGLCGFVAAQYAAYTAITDGDDFTMDLLRQNAESNGFASRDDVSVDKLRWGADEARAFVASHGGRPFDVVAGSDIIYAPESVPPLLDAVAALLAEDGTFLLAYEPRNVWMATVIDAAAARGLHVHCNLRDSIYHFRRGAPPAEGGAE